MNICYVGSGLSNLTAVQLWLRDESRFTAQHSSTHLSLVVFFNVPLRVTLTMRTFERVSGFLSHGQTQARSAVLRSSSSAPTPAAKQQIFAIHFYTQISLTLKMPKTVTHHSILLGVRTTHSLYFLPPLT